MLESSTMHRSAPTPKRMMWPQHRNATVGRLCPGPLPCRHHLSDTATTSLTRYRSAYGAPSLPAPNLRGISPLREGPWLFLALWGQGYF